MYLPLNLVMRVVPKSGYRGESRHSIALFDDRLGYHPWTLLHRLFLSLCFMIRTRSWFDFDIEVLSFTFRIKWKLIRREVDVC